MPITRAQLIDLWPGFTRLDPYIQALAGQLGDVAEDLATVHAAVIESFDLDNAVGVQLDKIGEIVQYERQGEADDRYRRLVRMQIQSILSSAGTTAVLLEIVRIWTDAEAPVYVEPPLGRAELQIGATLAAGLDDAGPLLMFLRRAKPGGVRLSLLETDGDGLVMDYTPASPVTGAGLTDYTPASPVTGAGTLGYVEIA